MKNKPIKQTSKHAISQAKNLYIILDSSLYLMYQSVGAAMTKYQGIGGLKNRNVFFRVTESRWSKAVIRVGSPEAS